MIRYWKKVLAPALATVTVIAARLGILLLPTILLLVASLRHDGQNLLLWLGTGFQFGVCCLTFMSRSSWRQPLGPSVITLYLIGLAWLYFGDRAENWYTYLAKSILLVVPLLYFAILSLQESGAPAMRRANILARRLSTRKDWPSDLIHCRMLPEVKALRAAITRDASPALALLSHPRTEVRVAALAALEFRKDWRPGQAELVLQVAQRAEQPAVRATAVTALGNIEDRELVETLAQFLHDSSIDVRRAAIEALLWDTEHRWSWIRFTVRRILADPLYLGDGPLVPDNQQLTTEAVNDLTAWCAEKGVIAVRAAETLSAHYHRALTESSDERVLTTLKTQLADFHTPAILRLEIGKLLHAFHDLDLQTLDRMVDPANPAPLRIIACEAILCDTLEEHDPLRVRSLSALKDLARLPNREIALATADVVQRRLGVDLGLAIGQALPSVQSRQAAEITRRVMQWATQFDDENLEDSRTGSRRHVPEAF